ncbi:MAG: hypothetical protein WDN46_08205 [Methylocella sp.]
MPKLFEDSLDFFEAFTVFYPGDFPTIVYELARLFGPLDAMNRLQNFMDRRIFGPIVEQVAHLEPGLVVNLG